MCSNRWVPFPGSKYSVDISVCFSSLMLQQPCSLGVRDQPQVFLRSYPSCVLPPSPLLLVLADLTRGLWVTAVLELLCKIRWTESQAPWLVLGSMLLGKASKTWGSSSLDSQATDIRNPGSREGNQIPCVQGAGEHVWSVPWGQAAISRLECKETPDRSQDPKAWGEHRGQGREQLSLLEPSEEENPQVWSCPELHGEIQFPRAPPPCHLWPQPGSPPQSHPCHSQSTNTKGCHSPEPALCWNVSGLVTSWWWRWNLGGPEGVS